MILARVVFQAKFNKANDLVTALKAMSDGVAAELMESLQPRILTDISGPFDTVVLETTHESLAALEEFRKAIFAESAASEEPSPITDLVVSGRNEYYTIE